MNEIIHLNLNTSSNSKTRITIADVKATNHREKILQSIVKRLELTKQEAAKDKAGSASTGAAIAGKQEDDRATESILSQCTPR